MTHQQPPVVENYENTITQIKEWPQGTPVSIRGRIKYAFELGEGTHGHYQSFYLEQGEGEIKVFWSSANIDLQNCVGSVVLLGQWNAGNKQGGNCKVEIWEKTGEHQLKVGGSCLKFEERSGEGFQKVGATLLEVRPALEDDKPGDHHAAPFGPDDVSFKKPPAPARQNIGSGPIPPPDKPTVDEVWELQLYLWRKWKDVLSTASDQAVAALINTVIIGVGQGKIIEPPPKVIDEDNIPF